MCLSASLNKPFPSFLPFLCVLFQDLKAQLIHAYFAPVSARGSGEVRAGSRAAHQAELQQRGPHRGGAGHRRPQSGGGRSTPYHTMHDLTCTFRASMFVVGASSDLGQPFCPRQKK